MTTTAPPPDTHVPDWVLCPGCRAPVYGKRFVRNDRVCPHCGRHGSLTAPERLAGLLDPGGVEPLVHPVRTGDPLGFVDVRAYPERLREARERTGLDEAVLCARGTVRGLPLIVAVMDFRFMGGSLGSAVGGLIAHAADTALRERTPLLLVTASGGARMQEGALALMQMATTSQAMARLDEAGILTMSLVTDPTYGGVAASFASLSDVIIAEPGARMGFAGARVIEQTIRQSLPPGFQSAESLLSRGFMDLVCPRSGLRTKLARLLSFASGERPGPVGGDGALIEDYRQLPEEDAWTAVRGARDLGRPTTQDYLGQMLDDFEELHGDRLSGDSPAIVAGLGRIDGTPLVVIGHRKGHTTTELVAHDYGMPTPSGYRKAARLMRLAAKLALPVVTLIDTPGAHPGLEAEKGGQAAAIAENLRLMSRLPVPVVAVVTGEGGSGGALALGVANSVLACSGAVYSVISPEGCAAILWKDSTAAPLAAEALRMGARDLLRLGIVDGVVPEPEGGAQKAPERAAARLREAVVARLAALTRLGPAELVEHRYARFRHYSAGLDDARAEGTT
ncbi:MULTISPECIES: acetyl-CoA carboxylase carboxyl transferase subunit alpha [unclassified Streptomyces]|uniref:acetyl-CoA carboxylase carboxyl transferase subunit alpha n=1 Tax=unclassified Streptomyces TaxID=2593676 RepID=UPI0035DF4F46